MATVSGENSAALSSLTRRWGFLRRGTIGRSRMGRAIELLSFGTGEAAAVFTAAHHGNEWITAAALRAYIERLAADYAAGDARAREIFRRARLLFIPLVNPDGADIASGGISPAHARRIAARYPELPYPSGWKADAAGVDLNLQYPAGWEEAREIKFAQGWRSCAPRDYVGRAPLCAPESRALYDFTRRARPKCALALHTQGEVIYWQYKGAAPPGAEALAMKLAAASGYALDTVPPESANAGYKDWVIDALGVPAFTVECGLGENPLPAEQLAPISAAVGAICDAIARYTADA